MKTLLFVSLFALSTNAFANSSEPTLAEIARGTCNATGSISLASVKNKNNAEKQRALNYLSSVIGDLQKIEKTINASKNSLRDREFERELTILEKQELQALNGAMITCRTKLAILGRDYTEISDSMMISE